MQGIRVEAKALLEDTGLYPWLREGTCLKIINKEIKGIMA